MKIRTVALVLLSLAAPALAAPGIDIAANPACPGTPEAWEIAEVDCVALSAASRQVRVYGTFVPAEIVSDLDALDGEVELQVTGDLETNASFWNGAPGACLEQHGGSVAILGTKPTNGDPCGSASEIREVFTAPSEMGGIAWSPGDMSYFFRMQAPSPVLVTPLDSIFGFELRFDPAFAVENNGPCGTCCVQVVLRWLWADPVSASNAPTTRLTEPTGLGYTGRPVTNVAQLYPAASCAVPTRAPTWGRLKSLYRVGRGDPPACAPGRPATRRRSSPARAV